MLRILSDLHLFDARSQVTDLAQLKPMLAGVQTLVLNGDSCEMRGPKVSADVASAMAFFRAHVPEVIFVTGNHDPDISEMHECFAADGRVWITHGDVCFDDLTPWSRHVPEIRAHLARLRADEPTADFRELAVRFRWARAVAREEKEVLDRTVRTWRARAAWFWRTFFPPQQVQAMARAWRELPSKARALAQVQRPGAQVIVTGHVHFPRVWRDLGQPTVINTGSFFRPLGGNLVDVFADHLEVRRVARGVHGFIPGRLVTRLELQAAERPSR